MKFVIFVAILTVAVCHGKSKYCKSQEDCGDGACCVMTGDPYRSGKCYYLAREGKKCNPPEAKLDYYGGRFLYYCPCKEGLECQEVASKYTYHKTPRCRNPNGVTGTTPASSESSESSEELTSTFEPTTDDSGIEIHQEGPGGGTDFDEEDIFHERE